MHRKMNVVECDFDFVVDIVSLFVVVSVAHRIAHVFLLFSLKGWYRLYLSETDSVT